MSQLFCCVRNGRREKKKSHFYVSPSSYCWNMCQIPDSKHMFNAHIFYKCHDIPWCVWISNSWFRMQCIGQTRCNFPHSFRCRCHCRRLHFWSKQSLGIWMIYHNTKSVWREWIFIHFWLCFYCVTVAASNKTDNASEMLWFVNHVLSHIQTQARKRTSARDNQIASSAVSVYTIDVHLRANCIGKFTWRMDD